VIHEIEGRKICTATPAARSSGTNALGRPRDPNPSSITRTRTPRRAARMSASAMRRPIASSM
jgi:hypothetical protein